MGTTYSTGALLYSIAIATTIAGLTGFTILTLWRIARGLRHR